MPIFSQPEKRSPRQDEYDGHQARLVKPGDGEGCTRNQDQGRQRRSAELQGERGIEQLAGLPAPPHQRIAQAQLRQGIDPGTERRRHGDEAEIGRQQDARQDECTDKAQRAGYQAPGNQPSRAGNCPARQRTACQIRLSFSDAIRLPVALRAEGAAIHRAA